MPLSPSWVDFFPLGSVLFWRSVPVGFGGGDWVCGVCRGWACGPGMVWKKGKDKKRKERIKTSPLLSYPISASASLPSFSLLVPSRSPPSWKVLRQPILLLRQCFGSSGKRRGMSIFFFFFVIVVGVVFRFLVGVGIKWWVWGFGWYAQVSGFGEGSGFLEEVGKCGDPFLCPQEGGEE